MYKRDNVLFHLLNPVPSSIQQGRRYAAMQHSIWLNDAFRMHLICLVSESATVSLRQIVFVSTCFWKSSEAWERFLSQFVIIYLKIMGSSADAFQTCDTAQNRDQYLKQIKNLSSPFRLD